MERLPEAPPSPSPSPCMHGPFPAISDCHPPCLILVSSHSRQSSATLCWNLEPLSINIFRRSRITGTSTCIPPILPLSPPAQACSRPTTPFPSHPRAVTSNQQTKESFAFYHKERFQDNRPFCFPVLPPPYRLFFTLRNRRRVPFNWWDALLPLSPPLAPAIPSSSSPLLVGAVYRFRVYPAPPAGSRARGRPPW